MAIVISSSFDTSWKVCSEPLEALTQWTDRQAGRICELYEMSPSRKKRIAPTNVTPLDEISFVEDTEFNGQGVSIFYHPNQQPKSIKNKVPEGIEILHTTFHNIVFQNMHIVIVYKSPRARHTTFFELPHNILNNISINESLVVTRDFSINVSLETSINESLVVTRDFNINVSPTNNNFAKL